MAVVIAAHVVQGRARAAAGAIVQGERGSTVLFRTFTLVAAALLLAVAVALSRRGPRVQAAWTVAIVALSFVPGYARTLAGAQTRAAPLPSLGMFAPLSSFVETYPGRPRVTYHFNDRGFRGPRWSAVGRRLCLVGDSFVFGSGVEWEDTLGEALRREISGVETLNLGVPGHNLESHLTLVDFGARSLHCDVIVLALTIPNDLTAWDINTELALRSRPSPYSLFGFLLGPDVATFVWNYWKIPRDGGPAERAELADGWARLSTRVPILAFDYNRTNALHTVLPRANVRLVDGPAYDEANFIPGDGHPTGRGNAAFAAVIARAIREDERFARPLGLSTP